LDNTTISFVPFYFSATIGINLLCAAVLLVSSVNKNHKHFTALLIGCIVATVYQYCTWQYLDSTSLTSALFWLKIQTSIVLLVLPLYVTVFLQWNKQTVSWRYISIFSIISIVFFVLNVRSEYTLRFSDNISFHYHTLFTGETVARISGDIGPYMDYFLYYVIAILMILIWMAVKLIQQRKVVISLILISTLIAQIAVAINSILIDAGLLNFIYLGGFPISLLNFLACISVANSLEVKTKILSQEINIRKKLESVFSSLVTGVSSGNNDEFYIKSLSELQKLSQADIAYLCLYDEESHNKYITTKVAIFNGKQIPNFSYPADITPNALISLDSVVVKESSVYEQFPDVPMFKMIEAEGFINSPLVTEKGKLEGSIVLVFRRKLQRDDMFMQALNIFTSRIAAEINRDHLSNKLHQMAYFDYQTNLPNLLKLHEVIQECDAKNKQNNTYSLLFVIDLKGFTNINRHYGFEKAEIAIRELGLRLRGYTDQDIVTARVGGNKFAVLISNIYNNCEALIKLHWEAIESLVRIPVTVDTRTIALSCNGGAVVFPSNMHANLEPIRCAEIALNQSKQSAHINLSLFDINILKDLDRKSHVEKLLIQAIKNNDEIYPVYQPKVDINGKLTGIEALARWQNKELGSVAPDEFISLAEKSGLISKLGLSMIGKVCRQIVNWKGKGFYVPGRVAINVSALQLIENTFVPDIIKLVSSYDVQPEQLELELTESGLLTNIEQSIDKLIALKEAGFTIALDDFGTGYSSLSYLKDLPIDVLKIDRSFVNGLNTTKAAEVARSIISIGQHMSMHVVAEGVEELAQAKSLHAMGCNVFQGYYFARPMMAENFQKWAQLEEHTLKSPKETSSIGLS